MENKVIISVVCSDAVVHNRTKLKIMQSLDDLFKKRERYWIIRHPAESDNVKFIHRVLIIDKTYQVIKQFEV